MNRWRWHSFLLILAVGCTTAEIVKNAQVEELIVDNASKKGEEERQEREFVGDTGKLDYENALRPAVFQKRSIANIARLLLGGNVPPNHPLVKYPEPKAWNLASNIVASLPGGSLNTAESNTNQGWGPQQNSALENIQQLFQTKAKIIPYTGQVATGLTGLASVKGDLLRQIHSISTQAIAQAAAEAAARALASAAAAHAVTNSIHSVVNPGGQTGIKGGWSSYQNTYANKPGPGDQPGPPYHSSSAHINHYQAPPSQYGNYNPYSMPATTPSPISPTLPSPVGYQQQSQNQAYQNGYYTLYNTQNSGQTPYTPAPPVGHARPTLSPNTLIATTPSGYSPSLSQPLDISPINLANGSSNDRSGRSFFRLSKPVIVVSAGSNNAPLTSFRRTVPAGIFGRNAPQPSSTSSLLSTISSLLSASTAAYNSAFSGGHQQQPSAVLSNLLSSGSSPYSSGAASIYSPNSIHSPNAAASSIPSSAANDGSFYNGYGHNGQQQSPNSVPQGSSYYGGSTGSVFSNNVYNQASASTGTYPGQTSSSSVHPSSYSFSQHAASNPGANYVQPGANPYSPNSVQPSSQFGAGVGAANPSSTGGNGGGASYSSGISGGFPNAAGPIPGSGYTGFNGGAGSSPGHVGGWNTQHAGPSSSASSWPSPSSNVFPPGYAGQASGNFNNPSGGFGGGQPPAQFQTASGSAFPQQAYPSISQNAYQSSTSNSYAKTQSLPSSAQYSVSQQQQQSPLSVSYGASGLRNTNINSRFDSHDLSQSASNMGTDYEDDDDSHTTRNDNRHHSYLQAQRNQPTSKNSYSSSRYPSPAKKRPTSAKKPSQLYNNHANLKNNFRHTNNGGNKRVIPQGNKKGSHFDSSFVDAVDYVDANVDVDNYEGENLYQSQEYPNKNRWRPKNPSGQRPNSFHNHNPNGRWSGEETLSDQASPANVRGNGPKRVRPQSGQSTRPSKNHRNQKDSRPTKPKPKEDDRKKQQQRPKTKASKTYGGRLEQQQSGTGAQQLKSRDVYTTLPEYVFRVGERTDVFLRPERKRKHGNRGRGILRPRVGETLRSGGDRSPSSSKTKESFSSSYSKTVPRVSSPKGKKYATTNHPDEEETSSTSSEEREEPAAPSNTRKIHKSTKNRGEDEEFISTSEALDETSRADVLSDSSFITASEEFDPEEREAFVDDVYAAEDHSHSQHHHHPPHRRQENYGDAGDEIDEEEQDLNQEEGVVEEDLIDKK